MAVRLITSESVTEGHPDKVCDQISDAVLDGLLSRDSLARCACDAAAGPGFVFVMGEISCKGYLDITETVRGVIRDIGYDDPAGGFDYRSCSVLTAIEEQSPDIAAGVNESAEYKDGGDALDKTGAGDQGMMYGYACRETETLMPLPIFLAHSLTRELARVRKAGELKYLRPDGKAQVTVAYDGGKPLYIDTAVISAQHSEEVRAETLRADLTALARGILPAALLKKDTAFHINPTGRFVTGGPRGDCGLTGRKIIADTYGGYIPHGGGAFSGKDPTKVDRSAAYMARYICKNVVASGAADRCQLEVAYAIGRARPLAVRVETFGTGAADDGKIAAAVSRVFDLRPEGIIRALNLRRPLYRASCNYGHFGGNPDAPWEATDKAREFADALKRVK